MTSLPQVKPHSPRHAEMATWAARLYAVSGVLALLALLLPAQEARDEPLVAVLAVADLAVAAVVVLLPRADWSRERLTLLAFATLAMVALFAWSGAVPSFGYPTFFLVFFAWAGLALPRGHPTRLAVPSAVAYVVPLVLRDASPELVASVLIAVPLMVALAETCAGVVARLDHDELTGVGNRRRAEELLHDLAPGDAVIMIDVDHFKEVNDRHGHAAGDRVLAELGGLLRRVSRDADLVARYGGEEFVVVVRNAAHDARGVAEGIATAWRKLPGLPTLSLGVAVRHGAESSADTLHRADRAVYDAKRSGRDRVCAV